MGHSRDLRSGVDLRSLGNPPLIGWNSGVSSDLDIGNPLLQISPDLVLFTHTSPNGPFWGPDHLILADWPFRRCPGGAILGPFGGSNLGVYFRVPNGCFTWCPDVRSGHQGRGALCDPLEQTIYPVLNRY